MTAAAICFTVLCLSAWVVATMDDSDPPALFDPWDVSESNPPHMLNQTNEEDEG